MMQGSLPIARPMTFWNVARQSRSYLNLLYLLVAFPLGIFYFMLLVTGLSVGMGTLIVWVGLPILACVGLAAWGLAAMEREMTIHWLGFDVPQMTNTALPENPTLWMQVQNRLTNPTTWKSLLYLFVKFPFGIVSFVVVIVLSSVALAFILAPVAYVVTTSLYHAFGWGTESYTLSLFTGELIRINGQFDLPSFLKLLAEMPLGLLLGLLSLHIFNAMAWMWGQFAQLMLGTPSQRVA